MVTVVEKSERFGERHKRTHRYDADIGNDGNEGTVIQQMWERWIGLLNQTGELPTAAEFEKIDARVFYTDTSSENPLNYLLQVHPHGPCGNFQGLTLGDLPSPLHREATAREWMFCKVTKQPTYTDIDQTVLGGDLNEPKFIKRKYRRLALPLRGKTGEIERLAYASVFFEPVFILPNMSSISSWRDFQAIAMSNTYPCGGYTPVESHSERLNPYPMPPRR